MSASVHPIAAAIRQHGLLNPGLSRAKHNALVNQIAADQGCSVATVYRWRQRLTKGQFDRQPRADRGRPRTLDPDVSRYVSALLVDPAFRHLPVVRLHELTQAHFADRPVSYNHLLKLREQIAAHLASYGKAYEQLTVDAPNSQWQIDCSVSDFFVAGVGPTPRRVQLTVCLDACTRSLMYACYTRTARYADIGHCLYHAIQFKSRLWPQAGLPAELLCDWGKNFLTPHLRAACESLGIDHNPAHPHYPQDKGKVEAVIGTIHHDAETHFPGFCGNDNKDSKLALYPGHDFTLTPDGWVCKRDDRRLLSLHEANAELHRWLYGSYHTRQHSELGMSPNEAWLLHAPQTRSLPESYLLESFLQRYDRVVANGCVRLNGLHYYHELLLRQEGRKLNVRYHPDDLREVLVYDDQGLLCTAVPREVINQSRPYSQEEHDDLRRANAAARQARRDYEQSLRAADLAGADPLDHLRAKAAAAPELDVQPPTILPAPTIPGLTAEQLDRLRGLNLNGVPLLDEDAVGL